jgi:hypothetical protein
MLGHRKSRRLDAPAAISLQDLVPQDHVYRHLGARLDLSGLPKVVGQEQRR